MRGEEGAVLCGGMCDLKRPLPPVKMLGESVNGEVSTQLMRFVLFPEAAQQTAVLARHLPLYMNEHNGTSRQDDRCYEAG